VPELSVVVPAVNSLDDVMDALAALDAQRADVDLEVLLVDRLGEHVQHVVSLEAPWVRILPVGADVTIPQMRALAFREAKAEAVAVIEDHVIVPSGWARSLLDGLAVGHEVVGGSVENAATETLLDWACFLCEYSDNIPPIPAGEVPGLTGNNVVYRRELLEQYRDVVEEGKWENHLHDRLRDDGHALFCIPEIEVGHKKHYTFGEYLSQRFIYARSYAGARVAGEPLPKRLAYGAAAFLLPPVLFLRIVSRLRSKGRHQEWLWKSLPLLAVFVTSWGAGEVAGYWLGGGNALSRVK
jgi:hypothetical protein